MTAAAPPCITAAISAAMFCYTLLLLLLLQLAE